MASHTALRDREMTYRLIISQLFYDGYSNLAVQLSNVIKAQPACPPSDRLIGIVKLGLEAEGNKREDTTISCVAPGTGLDLEFETEVQRISSEVATYETCYVTSHKGPCRSATYHPSGQVVATGSEDSSIKVLDVERMLAKSLDNIDPNEREAHPVIRTLYDHSEEVSTLQFHPTSPLLFSGSFDCTIKVFEYTKPSVKRSSKCIQEAFAVKSISLHPSGDYMLAGTEHPTIRLYDATTFQCYSTSSALDQHRGPITEVKFSPKGNLFATASMDGDIKVWDGVSGRCVSTFKSAHDSVPVSSVQFSRNSKYILSSGLDSVVRLWELSTSRLLIAYTGAGTTGRQECHTNATFNHTEDFALFPDEQSRSLCSWDARNADRQRLLATGHAQPVRVVCHSPTGPALMTCSDDHRARFWYRNADI
ncbi:DgyrCDS12082 [Dimorphilus gyrociliatus]|uniref:Cleavage stimulation factor 50 kDa subunit n=1 Tax=Dimorphilus gyrociliatus TaxID=2664684 RepID=A0A7I8W6N7_9ANNE|nr:DgyrCDS12082 [Dimorphilus gyrociliatus]